MNLLAKGRGTLLLWIILPAAAPLTAQTTLRGEVTAVQELRARIEIDGDRVPNAGDTVRLGTRVEGLGEVAAEGTWRVTEVGRDWVWADPVGSSARPLPGYWARVFTDNPRPRSSLDPGGEGGGGGTLSLRDFLSGDPQTEDDGPYCLTRNTPQGFLIRTVAESGDCIWSFWDGEGFEGKVRISSTMTLQAGEMGWGYGLRFGVTRENQSYYVLFVSGDGMTRLSRWDGDWIHFGNWLDHPAVEGGIGARNTLAVEVDDTTIRTFINGIPTGEFQTDEPVTGHAGYYLNHRGNELVIEELRVERLDVARSRGHILHHDGFDGTGQDTSNEICITRNLARSFSIRGVNPTGSCYWNLWSAGDFPDGVRITLEAEMVDGPTDGAYGLKFGTADRENSSYYAFLVTGDGRFFLARWDGSWRNLTEPTRSDAVLPRNGGANVLSVEVRGLLIDMYVNGRFLGSYRAPGNVAGSLALFVLNQGVEVQFQDLRVERLDG